MGRQPSSTRPLRVAMVGTSDLAGGAERFAERLQRALSARGHHCRRFVGVRRSAAADVFLLEGERRRSVTGLAAAALEHASGLQYLHYPTSRQLLAALRSFDVVHFHNLHGGYFALRDLPAACSGRRAVMTLHDCFLMTGHCAYPMDCPRWRAGCGSCPDLERYPSAHRDATRFNRRFRRQLLARSPLVVTAPSTWMQEQWLAADMPHGAPQLIPYGIDLDRFAPGDRVAAREALGLIPDDRLVAFIAQLGTVSPYKDGAVVIEAARRLLAGQERRGLRFLFLGGSPDDLPDDLRPCSVAPGFVSDEATVATYYRAADVLIMATRADNSPLVIIEALASGLPVVATDVGGIAELVADGERGALVPQGDSAAMAARVSELLRSPAQRAAFGRAARAWAVRHQDLQATVDALLALYR